MYFIVMTECHRRLNGHINHTRGICWHVPLCKTCPWVRFYRNEGLGCRGRLTCTGQGVVFAVPLPVLRCHFVWLCCPLEVGPQVKSAQGNFPSAPMAWLCLWGKTFFSCITVNTGNSVNWWRSQLYSWLLDYEYFQSTFFIFKLRLGIYFQRLKAKQPYLNTEIKDNWWDQA